MRPPRSWRIARLEQSDIIKDASWVTLLRLFLPSLVAIIMILSIYLAYRWKVALDNRATDLPDPERMRLEMEALAAEKKARREMAKERGEPEKKKEAEVAAEAERPSDGFVEGEPLA